MNNPHLQRLHELIGMRLEQIAALLPGSVYKITFLARHTGGLDADVVLTEDKLSEAGASLERFAARQAPKGSCVYCGGTCAAGDCAIIFTPIKDCEHKDAVDGCCRHPKNMTPECHVNACPRLHQRIKI